MKDPIDENFSIINLNSFRDSRGSLIAIEDSPFKINRIYYIYGNNKNAIRGKHAHKKLKQLLISVSGSCKVILDDGNSSKEIILNSPEIALFIKKPLWREIKEITTDCVLLCLASEKYNPNDYIYGYEEFIKNKNNY